MNKKAPRYKTAALAAAVAVLGGSYAAADTFTDALLADSPVGYWTLKESGGTNADNLGSAGSSIDGTYTAGTTQQVMQLLPTSSTLATDFDGTSGRVTIPDSSLINNTGGPYEDKTIELWFQAGSLTAAGTRQILWEQGGGDRGMNVYIDGSSLYVNSWNTANDSDNTPWGPISTSTTISAGKTYHVVLSHDGNLADTTGTVTGYVNGSSIGSVAGVGRLNNHADDIAIGGVAGTTKFSDGSQTNPAFFDGLIGHVAHYDGVALGSGQVSNHFAASGRENLEYNYQADDPVNAQAGSWASDVDQSSATRTWAMSGTLLGSTSSAFTGITKSYTYDGTDTAQAGNNNAFDADQAGTSATFEAWFKPTDLTGQEIVFTTGGATRGANISLDGSTLRFKIRENAGSIVDVLTTVELNDHEINEFLQVSGVIDQSNEIALYVNGSKRGSTALAGVVDWTGTNGAGLGSRGSQGGLGGETTTEVTGYGTLNGEIAAFRVYKGDARSGEQIMDNFLGTSGFSNVTSAENVMFVVNPTDVSENVAANETDEFIQMWQENTLVQLSSALAVDEDVTGAFSITGGPYNDDGVITAGTFVQSYYFHLDSTDGVTQSPTVTVTFDNEIIGLIWDNDNLDASNGQLGVSGVTYETSNGMEITGGTGGNDAITISADQRTLTLTMQVGNGFVDDLRVLTTPEPSSLVLLGLGGLLVARRRR